MAATKPSREAVIAALRIAKDWYQEEGQDYARRTRDGAGAMTAYPYGRRG